MALRITGANRHDSTQAMKLIDAIPPIRCRRGRGGGAGGRPDAADGGRGGGPPAPPGRDAVPKMPTETAPTARPPTIAA